MKKRIILTLICGLLLAGPAGGEEFPAVVEAETRAVLSAEREGVLSRLGVDVGDRVRKGDSLAEVFHRNLVLQKELKEANAEFWDLQVENLTRLNAKGLATDEELARARMEQAVNRKEIHIIETDIERSVIRAPFSGAVILRHVQPHEWVKPGQPVVELYDPAGLRIVADVPTPLAVDMAEGQSHSLFFPALNREITARVRVVAPQVDVRSNTVKVYWGVAGNGADAAGLIPGMKGVLRLERQ
jgi:membrane fusion protein (multidrug efflux system)